MSQVTCSLCNVKIDEIKWSEHLISTDPLQICKVVKDGIVSKIFNLDFETYHNRKDIYII